MAYVTCSVLPEENEDALAAFIATQPEFKPVGLTPKFPAQQRGPGLQMTPLATGCDGFFVAVLQKG